MIIKKKIKKDKGQRTPLPASPSVHPPLITCLFIVVIGDAYIACEKGMLMLQSNHMLAYCYRSTYVACGKGMFNYVDASSANSFVHSV